MKQFMINNRWMTSFIFIIVLSVNYLSASGILFSNTQQAVSEKHIDLLAPIGYTFSIWSVIYLGVAITISVEWLNHANTSYIDKYQKQIKPLFLQWMLLNILWIIAWSEELLLLAVILIAAYAQILLKIARLISQQTVFRSHQWTLKWPIGLHAGWIIFATFANLTTYGVSIGMDGTGEFAVWWTLIVIIVALIISAYLYATYGNEAIMLPILWGIFGVAMKHQDTEFIHANAMVLYGAWILLAIGICIYAYFTYLKIKQS